MIIIYAMINFDLYYPMHKYYLPIYFSFSFLFIFFYFVELICILSLFFFSFWIKIIITENIDRCRILLVSQNYRVDGGLECAGKKGVGWWRQRPASPGSHTIAPVGSAGLIV